MPESLQERAGIIWTVPCLGGDGPLRVTEVAGLLTMRSWGCACERVPKRGSDIACRSCRQHRPAAAAYRTAATLVPRLDGVLALCTALAWQAWAHPVAPRLNIPSISGVRLTGRLAIDHSDASSTNGYDQPAAPGQTSAHRRPSRYGRATPSSTARVRCSWP